MSTRILILLFICFPLKVFATATNETDNFLQDKTEAGFTPICSHCANQNEPPLLSVEQKNCLETITKEECKNIPLEEKRTCTKKDEMGISNIGSFLLQCIKDTALSFQFFFDLLWYGATSFSSWLFNSEQGGENSSLKSYLLIEFYKAYQSFEGTELERLLKAAGVVGQQTFSSIWSQVESFLQAEYTSFKCYKPQAQLTVACGFILGLFIPVPGAGLIALLKSGAKIAINAIKQPKSAMRSLTRMTQLKIFANEMRLHFSKFKSNALKKSEKLTRKQ
ncbi:MAG: hypothetical protein OXN83_05640, partial [Oligoflexia bacterium]|nr:hypothetical protein [Oligoflexia bacterium]